MKSKRHASLEAGPLFWLKALLVSVAVSLFVLPEGAKGQSGCTGVPAGLVSWWRGEGDASDEFGANSGMLLSGTTFAPGEVGSAFQFDGISGGVDVPASASLDVGPLGTGLTIEAWVNTPYEGPTFTPPFGNPGIGQPVVEWNNGSSFGAQLWLGHPNHPPGYFFANLVDTNGGYHVIDTAAGLVASNTLAHLAVTYDHVSGVAVLYLNGTNVSQANLGIFTPQTSYDVYIGQRPNSSFLFNGLVDEVSIYSRALSATEIRNIYNAKTSGKCIGPAAPSIIAQPQSLAVKLGSNAVFSVLATGSPTLSYQWFFNSNSIPGGTNLSLSIPKAQFTNTGWYSILVSNDHGTVTSSNAFLQVLGIFAFGNGILLTNSTVSFGGAVTIQLQSAYTNGSIFYTLDGSEPTFASAQYTTVFMIHQSTVLRAITYSADFSQSWELDPVAILIPPSYTLTVSGTVGGLLLVNPSGGSYLSNTPVTLSAVPTNGWTFLQWLGDLTGTNATNTINITRKKSVQAVFGTSLGTTVAGAGVVTLNPAGGVYPYGTTVRLTAIPQAGNYFGAWGNAASGNTNPLPFVVNKPNPTVSSIFGAVGSGQAALTVAPLGGGTITVNPRANIFSLGQAVSVTATPDPTQTFVGWSGDASGNQNPLSVTMDKSKLIYANFTHNPALSLRPVTGGFKPEGFVMTLTGDFGVGYQFLAASNLVDWVPLGTVTNTFGTVQFTDTTATNVGNRLYKALLQQ